MGVQNKRAKRRVLSGDIQDVGKEGRALIEMNIYQWYVDIFTLNSRMCQQWWQQYVNEMEKLNRKYTDETWR